MRRFGQACGRTRSNSAKMAEAGQPGSVWARISAREAVDLDTPAWQCTKRCELGRETPPKGKQCSDMLEVRGDHAGLGLDNVMETQLQTLVLAERAEGHRDRPIRIKDGEHVADPCGAVAPKLLDAAHGNSEWREDHGPRIIRPTALSCHLMPARPILSDGKRECEDVK